MAAAVKHTPAPWRTERDLQGDYRIVYNETGNWLAKVYADGESEVAKADAKLIAAAPTMLEALKRIRLWLAEEGCEEPLGLADSALRAAGVTSVTCPHCQGDGEWDEGPLPARSSTQIDPEYRQVKCPDCDATGRVALTAKESA